jgi:hypothetical protein
MTRLLAASLSWTTGQSNPGVDLCAEGFGNG